MNKFGSFKGSHGSIRRKGYGTGVEAMARYEEMERKLDLKEAEEERLRIMDSLGYKYDTYGNLIDGDESKVPSVEEIIKMKKQKKREERKKKKEDATTSDQAWEQCKKVLIALFFFFMLYMRIFKGKLVK